MMLMLLPDYVGMVGLAQLFEERDLPQDWHGHSVLGQGQLHLLDGHDLVTQGVPGFVHGPISSWGQQWITEEKRKQETRWWGRLGWGGGRWWGHTSITCQFNVEKMTSNRVGPHQPWRQPVLSLLFSTRIKVAESLTFFFSSLKCAAICLFLVETIISVCLYHSTLFALGFCK